MLSPHELSTLLLIQHSPSQVEPQCSDVASLEHERSGYAAPDFTRLRVIAAAASILHP